MTESETGVTIIANHKIDDGKMFQLQREVHNENIAAKADNREPFEHAVWVGDGMLERKPDGAVFYSPMEF